MKNVLMAVACTAGLCAQIPTFDVAALKLVPEGTRFSRPSGGPGTQDPERFTWSATTLTGLLAQAYGVSGDQISGPDWINSQVYSITANIPTGATREQFKLMLQNLLAERLHIAIHHEIRTINGYDLVIAKGGPKLKDAAPPDPARPGAMGGGQFDSEGATLSYPRAPIAMFANMLAVRLWVDTGHDLLSTRPAVRVVDKTGLTGTYNITLHYVPAAMEDVPGPDVFAALESQLGLKLNPVEMQLDTIVVDHAEKTPAEN